MTIAPTRAVATQQALADRLADPQVAAALASILDHADLLALLVDGLDGFIARSEVVGDNLIDGIAELRSAVGGASPLEDAGVDLGELVSAALTLASVLPRAAPALASVFEQGGGEHLALLTSSLARGTADFAADPVRIGGPLSLVRLLRDPDVNRALSFLATIARAVGRELATRPAGATGPGGHRPTSNPPTRATTQS